MSGLLTRPGTTAAKMVSAARVPNEPETLDAARSDGLSRVWDRLITPSPCCSSRPRPSARGAEPVGGHGHAEVLCGGHGAGTLVGSVWMERGARRGAPMLGSAEPLAGLGPGAV